MDYGAHAAETIHGIIEQSDYRPTPQPIKHHFPKITRQAPPVLSSPFRGEGNIDGSGLETYFSEPATLPQEVESEASVIKPIFNLSF